MERVVPPDPLSNKGDMVQNWRKWKNEFMIFMKLSNYIQKPQDEKAYLLRMYIGEFGKNVIEELCSENTADRNDMHILLRKLDAYFKPINEVAARYDFFTRHKNQNESIEDYITDLKIKAETCNFGNLKDSLIRDKVIIDLKDITLREKLFQVQNLDLSKLTSVYNEHETLIQKDQASFENTNKKKIDGNCWRCNQKHPYRHCPARNFRCEYCGEYHHYTSCCNKKYVLKKNKPNKNGNNFNMTLKKENIHHSDAVNTEVLSNMSPSVPSFPDVGKQLYPNLSSMTTSEIELKYKQNHIKQDGSVQRSVPTWPVNIEQQHNATTMQTLKHKENTYIEVSKLKQDKCTLS